MGFVETNYWVHQTFIYTYITYYISICDNVLSHNSNIDQLTSLSYAETYTNDKALDYMVESWIQGIRDRGRFTHSRGSSIHIHTFLWEKNIHSTYFILHYQLYINKRIINLSNNKASWRSCQACQFILLSEGYTKYVTWTVSCQT